MRKIARLVGGMLMMSLIVNVQLFGQATKSGKIKHKSGLIIYPAPASVENTMHNNDYIVKVRKPGGAWQDLFEYNVKVDLDSPRNASMAYFDFSGKVEVSVTSNAEKISNVKIRPSSSGIYPTIAGNTIYFTLSSPKKLSVEFNGDIFHNLHLFANAIETNRPNPKDPDVIYFGPGVHQPNASPTAEYRIPEGKTVYIAGGAVVRATLTCFNANRIKIMGRGIIDQAKQGVKIHKSNDIEVNGIIILNAVSYSIYGGESKRIKLKDIKSISSARYSDGIDLMSCRDVVIDDVFLRNSDDCIAVYGHRWDYYGNVSGYTISNSVLWADVAHPIHIGIHGDTDTEGEIMENMHFKNIDILEHDEDSPQYQGCMAINAGDKNLVRNVIFENIRVEDFEEGQLLNLRVVYNKTFNTAPGRGIENIKFKNIVYNGANCKTSVIQGYDEGRGVKNITFENLKINGRRISSALVGNIGVERFTNGVIFK